MGSIKKFIMHTYQANNSQIQAELQGLSPEAQAYIKQLEKESSILRILDFQDGYDFLEAQSLAFVSYLSKEDAPTGKQLDIAVNVFQSTIYLIREAMQMYEQERRTKTN